jgi:hypothetical protein
LTAYAVFGGATKRANKEAGMPVLPDDDSKINPLIWTAIEQRRLMRLLYQNRERIIEPHDCGVKKNAVKLLCYQIGGSSSHKLPNWRLMEEDQISDIQILDRTFPGGRPTPSSQHHQWDKLFIRVRPAKEDGK